jgi:hypothetical protein
MHTDRDPTTPDDPPNRRRYPRFQPPARVALRDRDGRWHWHDLRDASAVGVALADGPRLALDTRMPVQIERVGGGLGRVVRQPDGQACLDLERADAPAELRHRRIAWLASDAKDQRRTQRARPAPPPGRQLVVPLEFVDGSRHEAVLADLSASGLRAAAPPGAPLPPLTTGAHLLAGGTPAWVVWTARDGFAVVFDREMEPRELRLEARMAPGQK